MIKNVALFILTVLICQARADYCQFPRIVPQNAAKSSGPRFSFKALFEEDHVFTAKPVPDKGYRKIEATGQDSSYPKISVSTVRMKSGLLNRLVSVYQLVDITVTQANPSSDFSKDQIFAAKFKGYIQHGSINLIPCGDPLILVKDLMIQRGTVMAAPLRITVKGSDGSQLFDLQTEIPLDRELLERYKHEFEHHPLSEHALADQDSYPLLVTEDGRVVSPRQYKSEPGFVLTVQLPRSGQVSGVVAQDAKKIWQPRDFFVEFGDCAGAALNSRLVLTSARCAQAHKLDSGWHAAATSATSFSTQDVIVHPRFEKNLADEWTHDLALVYLGEPLESEAGVTLGTIAIDSEPRRFEKYAVVTNETKGHTPQITWHALEKWTDSQPRNGDLAFRSYQDPKSPNCLNLAGNPVLGLSESRWYLIGIVKEITIGTNLTNSIQQVYNSYYKSVFPKSPSKAQCGDQIRVERIRNNLPFVQKAIEASARGI